MELATDIMAIIGWAVAGFLLPIFSPRSLRFWVYFVGAISFGLIAASFVLG